jgi:predicted ribosomally synthesized peptide with nif11-like leader
MSQPNIKQLKAEDLSAEELRLQKVEQAIDDLFMAANSDETLKKQLEAATSSESFVEIATRQGYKLTVADIETLRRRTQQQAQLNSDEFDDELSERELELVAGGLSPEALEIVARGLGHFGLSPFPNWPPRRPPC